MEACQKTNWCINNSSKTINVTLMPQCLLYHWRMEIFVGFTKFKKVYLYIFLESFHYTVCLSNSLLVEPSSLVQLIGYLKDTEYIHTQSTPFSIHITVPLSNESAHLLGLPFSSGYFRKQNGNNKPDILVFISIYLSLIYGSRTSSAWLGVWYAPI